MRSVVSQIDRLLSGFYGICGYIAAACLVALTLLILASIISRLLGTFIGGLTEYSGYAMAAGSFLALGYTFREGGHIRVGILLNALSGKRRWLLEVWCLSVSSLFCGYLAFFLVRMTYVSWQLGDVSEGADAIELWIPQSATAFGAVVLAICVVHNCVRTLLRPSEPLAEVEKI